MKNAPIRQLSGLAIAALAAVPMAGTVGPAVARSNRDATRIELVESRPAGAPLMAIVSLRSQRVTIYDADGWILRAPVSSGQPGRETPAGVYSVLEKQAEHYSNLYDDAFMPFMQRITWSGIALHGGPLPGYAASHGCIRMPYEFAERLFDLTKIGMRVIVAPSDVVPVEISHPVLFKPKPVSDEIAHAKGTAHGQANGDEAHATALGAAPAPGVAPPADPAKPPQTWRSIAAARSAEAEAAARRADEARLTAVRRTSEAARATVAVRVAETMNLKAEARLKAADGALEPAGSPAATRQAEEAMTNALAGIAEAQARLTTAKLEAQPKADAAVRAREDAMATEAERVAASDAAKEAALKLSPVSVFISRKTQRLYVRQSFQPVLESPVTIRDADQPIGTHVYSVLDYTNAGADVRWSAVSLLGSSETRQPEPKGRGRRGEGKAEPVPRDNGTARTALDRITIPQDAIDRISEIVSPGSSLIISDEGISTETGNGTDFVILMSGEPQGGIKIRHHDPEAQFRSSRSYDRSYDRSYGRSFFYGGSFFRW